MNRLAKEFGWKKVYRYTRLKECMSFWSWVADSWSCISLYRGWDHLGRLEGQRVLGFESDWEKIK